MLDNKRRVHGHVLPPCTLTSVFISFMILSCFSAFWMLIGCFENLVVSNGNDDTSVTSGGIVLLLSSASASSSPTSSSSSLLSSSSNNISILNNLYTLNELQPEDENKLIDMKNFKFIINHDPCNKSQPLLLIVVHSAPGNFAKRQVIRDTWGKPSSEMVILYYMGLSEQYQKDIIKENDKYHDIIQGNFIDTYKNLTYKHVMALKWSIYHCPSAKYILKLDDDVFVNINKFNDFLKRVLLPVGARRLILCNIPSTFDVKRSWRSKWRVSFQEYRGKNYPTYCLGWAILYSPDSVFLLYKEAQKEPYFWIDDVHVTGTLAKRVNLTHSALNSFVLYKSNMKQVLIDAKNNQDFLFGPPNLQGKYIKALNRIILTGKI